MRILVVVLNWNGADDTLACLGALEEQTHDAFDVLVIDNGSAGDDVDRIRAWMVGDVARPRMILHEEPENLGFAGGVNVGIRRALDEGYDAVALLNNDAVPEPGWLAALDQALERTGASVAAGLMLRESDDPALRGTIDTAGDAMSIWGMPFPRGRGSAGHAAPETGAVFSASGGSSLYRAELFRGIGLFDETFFAYFEDVDIGFRARLAGHAIVYDPAAVVHHRIGATSGRIPGFTVRQTFQNLPVLLTKNVPRGLRHRIVPRFALLLAMMLAKATLTGSARPAWSGLARGIRLAAGHGRRERARIQSARRARTADIDAMLWHDLPPEQSGMRRLLRPFRR
ncbi:glycosyltransferase family 2 protein [Microbacterium karelineae]|uniref:glycosyltransferase family 2 protein n=1 Tax=Microbacterium karelineae TaxID=2654283 RepID=UPI0018D48996|nr:glycosyltransferase family 2 protein [Microbacterium karelineae]